MSLERKAEEPSSLVGKVETLPRSPGVYLMKDRKGRVVYVGKAKDLRTRVRSYFRSSRDLRPQIPALMDAVDDLDFIATDTEKEALILENNLIKQHQPRYNVNFKDDKDYLSLRLDLRDSFPKLTVVRRPPRDGALYFGPYASSRSLRETLRFIYRIFPIRSCKDTVFRTRTRPCLYYQIHRCVGPCVTEMTGVTPEEYREWMNQVVLFLRGRKEDLIRLLRWKRNRSG
jgi:excinuclease ABC subunit C